MSCINKADKAYKSLQSVYGDNLAEAFVRGYPTNKGMTENMEFNIPSRQEVKDWLTQEKSKIPRYIQRAMEINPYMSEAGIKSMLKGVIGKHNDVYFITSGWLYAGSTAISKEVLETVYKPNIKVMMKLQEMYPDIFNVRTTRNSYATIVEITPRIKGEETTELNEELEEDELGSDEPEITQSIREYKEIVKRNNGRKPIEFMAGNFKWQLNKDGLYNLVDKFTNDVYLRNMDLDTGEIVPVVDPRRPLSEDKRDRIYRSFRQLIKEQALDEYLAVKGIDVADIYTDLREATTDQDLNKILEILLKAIC